MGVEYRARARQRQPWRDRLRVRRGGRRRLTSLGVRRAVVNIHNKHYAKSNGRLSAHLRTHRTLPAVIDSKETPSRQPTNARFPTNNRPKFVDPPTTCPDEGTTTDNLPEIPRSLADLSVSYPWPMGRPAPRTNNNMPFSS